MNKVCAVLCLLALAGCGGREHISSVQVSAEAQRHCDYIGQANGDDGYGGVGKRGACMRYVRDTGRLPPPS